MITAVLDTNALASGFVRSNPAAVPVQIIDAWRNRGYQLVVSDHILTEFAHTLAAPYFGRRLTTSEISDIFAILDCHAITVDLTADNPSHCHAPGG